MKDRASIGFFVAGVGVAIATLVAEQAGFEMPTWLLIGLALCAFLLIVGGLFSALSSNKVALEGVPMGDDNSMNFTGDVHQHGDGIIAHTVNIAETPPNLNMAVLRENAPEGDRYRTEIALELMGRPPVLGVAAKGEQISEVRIRQDGPSTALFNVEQGSTTAGYEYFKFGNPAPGRYIAEITTNEPVAALDVRAFLVELPR
jgi:hypothetical protein